MGETDPLVLQVFRDIKEETRETNALLREINGHFSNGFREEIKAHGTAILEKAMREMEVNTEQMYAHQKQIVGKVDKIIEAIATPRALVKLLVIFLGLQTAIVTLASVIFETVKKSP